MPPIAVGLEMPWDALVADPVAAIGDARAMYGETFVVDSGPDRYLFTFDPVGVRSFYRLPEASASKGIADWRMLRRKMPEEIFDGRRVLPHDLFARDDVANYLTNLSRALDAELSLRWATRASSTSSRCPVASVTGSGCRRGPARPVRPRRTSTRSSQPSMHSMDRSPSSDRMRWPGWSARTSRANVRHSTRSSS